MLFSGSTQLRCESDSSWDQIPPVCSRTPCPDITMNPGVEGFLGDYVYEDTPALYCSVGYHESAPSTLMYVRQSYVMKIVKPKMFFIIHNDVGKISGCV